MRLLLDTHVFLWSQDRPERLGSSLSLLEDLENDLWLSAASAWEIAIKWAAGRLTLPEPPALFVPSRQRTIGAEAIAVDQSHALAVSQLPHLHRDPFDRVLVAQAQMLELTIVTADRAVAQYDVESILV